MHKFWLFLLKNIFWWWWYCRKWHNSWRNAVMFGFLLKLRITEQKACMTGFRLVWFSLGPMLSIGPLGSWMFLLCLCPLRQRAQVSVAQVSLAECRADSECRVLAFYVFFASLLHKNEQGFLMLCVLQRNCRFNQAALHYHISFRTHKFKNINF